MKRPLLLLPLVLAACNLNINGPVTGVNGPINAKVDVNTSPSVASPSPSASVPLAATVVVSTFAGTGAPGIAEGAVESATFTSPGALALDSIGNLYVAENGRGLIRKISSGGNVKNIIVDCQDAVSLAMDSRDNLYVSDSFGNRILVISSSGDQSVFAGVGVAGYLDAGTSSAEFDRPRGLAIDSEDSVYVSDGANYRIRKIANGLVTTIAGDGYSEYLDGVRTTARLRVPGAIACGKQGSVYVCDGSSVRKILSDGSITTLSGGPSQGFRDGPPAEAKFYGLTSICADSADNLYVSDLVNNRIRMISATGYVQTIAGSFSGYRDGYGDTAELNAPAGVALYHNRTVYVSDGDNRRIRRLVLPQE